MKSSKALIEYFSVIPDPRIERQKKHKLIDVIVITICGVICGCETFVDIANYGRTKKKWLEQYLELPNGIPSHDTLGRVFSLLSTLELQKAFYAWTQSLVNLRGEIISLDGKYVGASKGATANKRSLFGMVNAWASEAGIALAQLRTDYEKRGEKQAFRDLIDFLELEGALVTIDANGAHADICNKIVDKRADFLVALKANQKGILESAKLLLARTPETEMSHFESVEKGHGRIETRMCEAINLDDNFLESLKKKNKQKAQVEWRGLRSVCKLTSKREIKGVVKEECRYYMSSIAADAKRMATAIRSHWHVENKLHWVLDVSFNEDGCRIRNGYAGENMAVIRQLAINLLKQDKTPKKSVNSKRLICGWENEFLETILIQMNKQNIVI